MKSTSLVIALLLINSAVMAQNIKVFHLKQGKINYSPRGFYISKINDSRSDGNVATIYDHGRQPAAIENGVRACFENYANSLKQDRRTQPIILQINKLNFEIKKQGKTWKADASASFSFYAGDDLLVEFTGKGHGENNPDPGTYMENFIRQTLESDLKKFDAWWEKNRSQVPTNPLVKMNVTLGKTSEISNSIVYAAMRPLQIADFQGPPVTDGPEMAATMSGSSFGYYTQTENSQLVVNITITPYFDKRQSWFREAGKNARLLAHEQLHFDIDALYACKFADELRKSSFTRGNFAKQLDLLQQKNKEETDKEENLYDDETHHGTIADKQDQWEQTIKAKLRGCGCFN